ncbi:putative holin [Dyella sp. 20L07]|uniref:putative holin n=1 Tax=Dyella sp. 20L07 TaxID=3384240 RepID=UPI003D268364
MNLPILVRFWARLQSVLPSLRDKLRATPLLIMGAMTFLIVLMLNPAKVGLLIWGASRLGLYAYLGYWVDRIIFPYARPHTLQGVAEGTAWKRRALIVAAAILAGALLP